jgi:hypothetical protein
VRTVRWISADNAKSDEKYSGQDKRYANGGKGSIWKRQEAGAGQEQQHTENHAEELKK